MILVVLSERVGTGENKERMTVKCDEKYKHQKKV
jgi:hypothetical protein